MRRKNAPQNSPPSYEGKTRPHCTSTVLQRHVIAKQQASLAGMTCALGNGRCASVDGQSRSQTSRRTNSSSHPLRHMHVGRRTCGRLLRSGSPSRLAINRRQHAYIAHLLLAPAGSSERHLGPGAIASFLLEHRTTLFRNSPLNAKREVVRTTKAIWRRLLLRRLRIRFGKHVYSAELTEFWMCMLYTL